MLPRVAHPAITRRRTATHQAVVRGSSAARPPLHCGYPRTVSRPSGVPAAARDAILAWYGERGRPLAFRRTSDPYAILVSEVMAQQTQVARVAARWTRLQARPAYAQANFGPLC